MAIHCKAGLGRTGTLICCYIMKHFMLTAAETIAWNRICLPGSVIGPQQFYLQDKQTAMWRAGALLGVKRKEAPETPLPEWVRGVIIECPPESAAQPAQSAAQPAQPSDSLRAFASSADQMIVTGLGALGLDDRSTTTYRPTAGPPVRTPAPRLTVPKLPAPVSKTTTPPAAPAHSAAAKPTC